MLILKINKREIKFLIKIHSFMTKFYIFRSKIRILKKAFLGVVYKTVFLKFFCLEITLKYLKNNIYHLSLIRAIDWYANYDIM